MAWTSPTAPYFSVAEVVTASKMNVLSNDLRYLKGMDGQVDIEDTVTIPAASGTDGKSLRFVSGATGIASFQGFDTGGNSFLFFSSNRYFNGTAWQNQNTRAAASFQIVQDAFVWYTFGAASSTPVERMRLTNAGNLGVGTATPAAPLHIAGAGGGFLFVSCNAVDGTLQTPIVAGTVTQYIQYNGSDRNNGTGTCVTFAGTAATLGSTFTVVNSDTVTITVTAGGAITVQRTAGSSGSHQINFWIMFR